MAHLLRAKPRERGPALPGYSAQDRGRRGRRARPAPGGVGEIVISGPQLAKGYWKQPEETARVLRTDAQGVRWLYTGDIGYMDEAGYFYVVDRKKDTIIVAGYNVYPSEIESVLLEHPAVAEAAVIGVDDRARGQRIEAYVVLAPGAMVTEQALLEHCKANMAPYKIPRRVIFRESLPKNAVGKVRRAELARAEAEAAAADRPDFTITPAPPDVTPEGFFTELLPRDFAAYVTAHPPGDALDATTFTVQYTVDGAVYALHIVDGRALRVTREAAPSPDIAVTTDLESWRDSVTGRVFTGLSPVAQGATAQRRAKLAEVRGTVHLELARADGSLYRATATYNGETGAAVVIRMSTADYSDMQRGRLSGAEALVSGKLQAQGDLGVLQALAAMRA
ncbi:MAG: AMP-binding protein [Anaerolineae bacterium]|nr:AMP-binding protein [Anaerolineae bacterium]